MSPQHCGIILHSLQSYCCSKLHSKVFIYFHSIVVLRKFVKDRGLKISLESARCSGRLSPDFKPLFSPTHFAIILIFYTNKNYALGRETMKIVYGYVPSVKESVQPQKYYVKNVGFVLCKSRLKTL